MGDAGSNGGDTGVHVGDVDSDGCRGALGAGSEAFGAGGVNGCAATDGGEGAGIMGGAGEARGGGGRAVGVSKGEALGSFRPAELSDAGTGDNRGVVRDNRGVVTGVVAGHSVGIGPTGYEGGSFGVEVPSDTTA